MQNISTWPQIAQDCGRLEGTGAAGTSEAEAETGAAGTGVTGLD
jgi:hypothetical protein